MRWVWVFLLWCHIWVPASPNTGSLDYRVYLETNRIRKEKSLAPLRWDPCLARVARGHSQDMASLDFFDHTSLRPGKETVEQRVRLENGPEGFFRENLFWCRGLPEEQIPGRALKEWLESPDHRQNLLAESVARCGVGVARKGREFYLTQVLADSSPEGTGALR